MKLVAPFVFAAFLAACGESQQQASQEPYSAPSSPDASGQAGYATDPGYTNQQNSGAEGGRGSAATGASGQGFGDTASGDASSQQQPVSTP